MDLTLWGGLMPRLHRMWGIMRGIEKQASFRAGVRGRARASSRGLGLEFRVQG